MIMPMIVNHLQYLVSELASFSSQQNKAIAAILANRAKIAGSDSDSDDSDSEFTDDMY